MAKIIRRVIPTGTIDQFITPNIGQEMLLRQCCSKEFSVFMVSGCYHFCLGRVLAQGKDCKKKVWQKKQIK